MPQIPDSPSFPWGVVPTDEYFTTHLEVSRAEAIELHQRYYTDYGLAISGLILHHKVDPVEYNRKVDDALPLDTIITPDPNLRTLLEDMDKSKVKLWLLTNAYITHGKRIVKLLGVEDLFEGITYCDYATVPLVCKPHEEMYVKAEAEAQAPSSKDCYFVGTRSCFFPPSFLFPLLSIIQRKPSSLLLEMKFINPQTNQRCTIFLFPKKIDDSHLNCRYAQNRGWTTMHLLEPEDPEPTTRAAQYQIRSLEEIRTLFPQFFVRHVTADSVERQSRSASG